MAKITLRKEGHADEEYRIKDRLSIGRRNSNDIVINDNLCSRDHAVIFESEGSYRVRDLGSHNGTYLNGEKISERELGKDDVIRIGNTEFYFSRASVDTLLGQRIGGYKILEVLGEGGMGKVYKARQIAMDRLVALKVLSSKVTEDDSFIAAFKQEAKVAGQLNHHNVVSVHDFGKTDDGNYFLSMEFVDGENIQEILQRKGKLSTAQSVIIISEVAKALKFAHSKSIIHSDVKPQNILLDKNGNVKVADLGLAKYFGKSSFDRKQNTVMGTPYYMSPEQATKGRVDARTDIYSLGATLFHMVTGRPPFDGETPLTILTKHVTEEVPSPRKYDITISHQISSLIKKMMAKSPDDRHADISEVEKKLDLIKNQEQGKQAVATARKGYVADIRKSMTSRRKREQNKQKITIAVSMIIAILLLAAVFIAFKKQMAEKFSQDRRRERKLPLTFKKREPDNAGDNNVTESGSGDGIEFSFKDISQKDELEPLGKHDWKGWNFASDKGFLGSPAHTATGFRCKKNDFSSMSFRAELVLMFESMEGSVSFSVEGRNRKEATGIHLNPGEIIIFSPDSRKTIPVQLRKNARVSLIVNARQGRNTELLIDGTKAGEIVPSGLHFMGAPVFRIDNTVLRIYYLKVSSGT